jgi:hypothetical protein
MGKIGLPNGGAPASRLPRSETSADTKLHLLSLLSFANNVAEERWIEALEMAFLGLCGAGGGNTTASQSMSVAGPRVQAVPEYPCHPRPI